MDAVIEVRDLQRVSRSPVGALRRRVPEVRALDGVTFSMGRGELEVIEIEVFGAPDAVVACLRDLPAIHAVVTSYDGQTARGRSGLPGPGPGPGG